MIKEKSNKKEFDTVKFFREVKEKISIETQDMTYEELKAYIGRRELRLAKP